MKFLFIVDYVLSNQSTELGHGRISFTAYCDWIFAFKALQDKKWSKVP